MHSHRQTSSSMPSAKDSALQGFTAAGQAINQGRANRDDKHSQVAEMIKIHNRKAAF